MHHYAAPQTREELDARFTALMQEMADDVLRLCYLLLRDRALAEDAMQDVFLKVYRKMDSLRQPQYARTWVISIAVNTCRDIRRSAWMRHTDMRVALEDLPPAVCEFTAEDDSVVQEIMALEPKYREILLLHYYQDMSAAQCARVLRLTPSGFYRRLKKAQDKLREHLERWVFDA